jgi:hypothetical protein
MRLRHSHLLLLLLAGCAGNTQGKWPSLAARSGEASADVPRCAGCGQDVVAAPAVAPVAIAPLPTDVDARLGNTTQVVSDIEARAPAQARAATAAIVAARGNPERSGAAEVERSRYEALFMPLSIEERRLEVLSDDIAGRDGAAPVLARIAALRDRIAALQQARGALPD